jgi:hypothetical protein
MKWPSLQKSVSKFMPKNFLRSTLGVFDTFNVAYSFRARQEPTQAVFNFIT